MENATKALTMAGGVLIALMIVSMLLFMFSNLSSYQNQNDASVKQTQIAEFNNQYMPYDKNNLTLMELKSVYNKIMSHNSKNPTETIETNIKNIYSNIEEDFETIDEQDKRKKKFKCIEIGYDTSGKINNMNFADVTN